MPGTEPQEQAKIVKQEASNQELLTIMLHPSEHRADGPQHIITNIDCCFKEKCFLIIIKHSYAGRVLHLYMPCSFNIAKHPDTGSKGTSDREGLRL